MKVTNKTVWILIIINDLKSIGNSKKINNAKGKKQEKVSRFRHNTGITGFT